MELAPLRDPDHVLAAIADALSLRGEGTAPLLTADELRTGRVLIVLDNMEYLIAARNTVLELLASCHELSILTTSREVLRVRGERVYTLGPLDPPEREADIELSPAVRLFLDRARAAGAEVRLD